MSENKVTVAGEEYTIASPSLDKTMRITDHVSEILEELPGIFDEVENYKIEYKINHREVITKEEVENIDNKEIVQALGISLDDFEDDDNLIYDPDTDKKGIPFYKSPSETEIIAAIFPKVWKAARSNVIELCALLITTDGELEEHDKRGAVNGLIQQRSHWLRHKASLPEILEIISIGIIIFKEQLDIASNSLGKVTDNLTQMLSKAQPEAESQEAEKSDKPEEEQK